MPNIRFALRTLFRTPFVTIVAIVSLALGIGANAAFFSIFSRLKIEKIAAFAPMPSASETMATMVTKGVRKSVRSANLMLGIMIHSIDVSGRPEVYPPRGHYGSRQAAR